VPSAALNSVIGISGNGWDPVSYCLAVRSDGQVIAWGNPGTYGTTTVPAEANSAVAVAAGLTFAMALRSDGEVVCWGDNTYGQCDVPADALSSVVEIACNYAHAVALRSDGKVVCWGYNNVGQTDVPAGALADVIHISACGFGTLAVKNDNTLLYWGGAATVSPPVTTNIADATGAYNDAMVLKTDGTIVCWGQNIAGILTPPQSTNIAKLGTGGFYNLTAINSSGSVLIWGFDNGGQVSNIPSEALSNCIGSTESGDVGTGYAIVQI